MGKNPNKPNKKQIMKTYHCIYQEGRSNIVSVCCAEEGEVLKSPYGGELFEDLVSDLNEKREEGTPEYQIMKLDDAMPLIEASQKAEYCKPWVEISKEEYWDALGIRHCRACLCFIP